MPLAAASTKTIPKPSCSSPSHLLRQSITMRSLAPSHGLKSSSETRPKKTTGAFNFFANFSSRSRSRPDPPIATCRVGMFTCSFAEALMRVSMPFRGTKREYELTRSASGLSPSFRRTSSRFEGSSGTKRLVSTPGGI